jgi:uncharacterized protein (DUF488 family)
MTKVFTVGHGNRAIGDFLALLGASEIRRVVDVRRTPYSGRFPWFGREPLAARLAVVGLDYRWWGEALGGRRSRPASASAHPGLARGLRGFAEHMTSAVFAAAMVALRRHAEERATALMCAEIAPGRCHRRLIADWLVLNGVRVVHLVGPGEFRGHRPDPAARMVDGRLCYEAGGQIPLQGL